MRTLRPGQDLLCGCFCAWRQERSGAFQADRLAADDFQPGPPDATTRPVAALAPELRQVECWLPQEEARNLSEERRAATGPRLFRRGLSVVLLS